MYIILLDVKVNNVKEINNKNRTYYFLNDMINIKNIKNKINIDKKSFI